VFVDPAQLGPGSHSAFYRSDPHDDPVSLCFEKRLALDDQ